MTIPSATVSRLVTYLRILEELELSEVRHTSSGDLAERAQVTAFQVRKDLTYVGRHGTRGKGYTVAVLKREIIRVLGLNQRWKVVIVGMGRLGHAIANFPVAAEYQFEYAGLFDVDPNVVGTSVGGLPIRHMSGLPKFVSEQGVDMAFLTVPPERAQAAAEQLVQAGIYSILNFAPIVLRPPAPQDEKEISKTREHHNVTVENVDFLAGMKRLAYYTRRPSGPEAEDI
ncbi:Redox-sensing transcriptional repressor rex [Deinococcus proteolyticus MRP]|uniref:Redox-sensing transcriptional repressor Rex n=1 Tax=Deinococcus proteolyticus (strain ATCC 35074 / DSM 20540 / JCM 6276 / NBRC 101906 / NCIMB 13154 / VKM Ac-1939 / CCM 2703 / MRP) TaxID=693977 RepID=F0RNK4_DEIPM|nr:MULTISPECIES: redox-sensing transcriptional repressor Rex [Deinococcus]ADY26330.1 Redox-sensing transcriptional repressor rex [Deinococcus proteolyticus MRP]MCY1702448.1 redox-sensing transcriptional repressor Rex [Deinococcus sp. SL84]